MVRWCDAGEVDCETGPYDEGSGADQQPDSARPQPVGHAGHRYQEPLGVKTLAEDLVGEQAELKLTAFETRYARLIDFGADTFHMVNWTRVTATGAELQGRYTPSAGVSLQAAYTRIRHRSDEPLRGLPRQRASLGWPWQPGDSLRMDADSVHVGRTADLSTPTGKAMLPGHNGVDVSLQQRLTPRLTSSAASLFVYVEVENAGSRSEPFSLGLSGIERSAKRGLP